MNFLLVFFAIVSCLLPTIFAYSGYATFYYSGQTACGHRYDDSDYVCALSSKWFTGPKALLCDRKIKVINSFDERKSVTLKVVDRCGTCDTNDIDMSPEGFKRLAPLSYGRIGIKWYFV